MSGSSLRPLALLMVLLLSASPAAASTDPFPEFEELRGNVVFWIQVFSAWSIAQVAVHDLEYPAVIYEVVDLPGEMEGRYTDEQEEFVEDLRIGWEEYLEEIQKKVAKGKALDEVEQKWVEHIETMVGPGALEDSHKRVRTQRGLRERFVEGLERSFRYDRLFRDIFREEGLPEDLAFLPHVESSFQDRAKSSAGATGMWQFTRSTGKHYMTINSAIDERLDPVAATWGAAGYLRDAYDRLGSWPLALTSYNYGVHGMARAKERFGDDFVQIYHGHDGRSFGFASKNFYCEFLAAREIAGDPARFFPQGFDPEPVFDRDSVELERRTTPARIASRYGVPLAELAEINPAWSRRAVKNGLSLPTGTTVWLTAGTRASAASRSASVAEPEGWLDDDGHYVVQSGDNLSVIAEAYGVSLTRLREWNDIPRGSSLIRPGQRLRISSDPGDTVYIVRSGDTLSEIATRHSVSLRALREVNDMRPGATVIRPGQRLRVPPSTRARSGSHVVRTGDTLLEIASRYGVRLVDLLSANTLSIHSVIHPGQTLRIP